MERLRGSFGGRIARVLAGVRGSCEESKLSAGPSPGACEGEGKREGGKERGRKEGREERRKKERQKVGRIN